MVTNGLKENPDSRLFLLSSFSVTGSCLLIYFLLLIVQKISYFEKIYIKNELISIFYPVDKWWCFWPCFWMSYYYYFFYGFYFTFFLLSVQLIVSVISYFYLELSLQEMERSADVLAAGLLEVADPSLSSKFFLRQVSWKLLHFSLPYRMSEAKYFWPFISTFFI